MEDLLEQNQISNNRKNSSAKPLKPTFIKVKEGKNQKNNKISPSTRNVFYSESENCKNATNKNQKLVTNSVSQPNFVEFLDNNLSVQQNKIINAADEDHNKNLISDVNGIGQENRFVKKASDNTTVDNSEASKIDSHVPIQLEQFCSPMGSPPM